MWGSYSSFNLRDLLTDFVREWVRARFESVHDPFSGRAMLPSPLVERAEPANDTDRLQGAPVGR